MLKIERNSVVFIDHSGPRNIGGTETVRTRLTEELTRRERSTSWVYPEWNSKRLDCVAEPYKNEGLVSLAGFNLLGKDIISAKGLIDAANLILKSNPDKIVVGTRDIGLLPLIFTLSALADKDQMVYIHHGLITKQGECPAKKRVVRKLSEFVFKKIHERGKNIAVSETVKSDLIKHGLNGEISVCYPPGNYKIPNKESIERRHNKVANVSRIDEAKGLPVFTLVAEKLSSMNFIWVGGEALYRMEKPELPNLKFLGIKQGKNLSRELLSASTFLFPSEWEGFGLVLPEAMQHGCIPVVCNEAGKEILSRMSLPELSEQAVIRNQSESNDDYSRRVARAVIDSKSIDPEPVREKSKNVFNPELLSRRFVEQVLS